MSPFSRGAFFPIPFKSYHRPGSKDPGPSKDPATGLLVTPSPRTLKAAASCGRTGELDRYLTSIKSTFVGVKNSR